jgi:hypothetical protein
MWFGGGKKFKRKTSTFRPNNASFPCSSCWLWLLKFSIFPWPITKRTQISRTVGKKMLSICQGLSTFSQAPFCKPSINKNRHEQITFLGVCQVNRCAKKIVWFATQLFQKKKLLCIFGASNHVGAVKARKAQSCRESKMYIPTLASRIPIVPTFG